MIGQLPVCWDRDRSAAIERAHDQFRWFGGGWSVNADLPTIGDVGIGGHCDRVGLGATTSSSGTNRLLQGVRRSVTFYCHISG